MPTNRDDRLWYGKYGGCFIADAFTLACDRYYDEYCKATSEKKFMEEYERLKLKYVDNAFKFSVIKENKLISCKAPENIYPILGTALLARYLGKKQALCGVRYADEAFLCARVCADLGINVKLFLSADISGSASLTEAIAAFGASFETKQCRELFNLPEMYAFQGWVASPDDSILINCRLNAGAFPQVNIATDFAKEYGERFKEALKQNGISGAEQLVVPCVSGSFALGILKAFEGDKTRLVSVECDSIFGLSEELDSYCGTFTKVMRNNICDRVLAPELVFMMDKNEVIRKTVNYEAAAAEMKNSCEKTALSLQSYAVLSYCKANLGNSPSLCVVREERFGAAL